jgi:hypothetical protein
MTEAEWMACTNPTPMWWFVEGKASARRLRLVACACCRRIWHLLSERSKQLVEAAEQLADGLITAEESEEFLRRGSEVDRIPLGIDEYSVTRSALISHSAITRAVPSLAASFVEVLGGSRKEEASCQCVLVRDILGNPFHPVPTLDPGWLRWNDGTVRSMAQTVYDERAFGRLPVLADALEDAGCADVVLLGHLRDPGVHVRGCWALDLILERT